MTSEGDYCLPRKTNWESWGETSAIWPGNYTNGLTLSEEEKRRFEAILKNMSDGLILTDTKGKIILVNDALKNLFGIPHSIEGKTVMEALRKAELMEVIEEVAVSRERISRGIEIAAPRHLDLLMTAAPFYSQDFEGDLSGIVLTFHDITRLKNSKR